MKRVLVLAFVLFVGAATTWGQRPKENEPEQYPGQHQHARPPEGYRCSNRWNAPKNQKCDCRIICVIKDGQLVVDRAEGCSSYCWEKEFCFCSHDGCEAH